MANEVELIPGTSLPLHVGPGGYQAEGRGEIELRPERGPVSLLEKIQQPLTDPEFAFVSAALRAYSRQPRLERVIFDSTAKATDSSTGNLVIPFFVTPAGYQAHLTSATIDVPNSTTITPTAPFSSASAWAFIACLPSASSGSAAAQADGLRVGMVAFAPGSSAGPFLPGQWTFTKSQAPVGNGGDQFYFVMHGGSVAALLGISVQITYRIDLYSYE